MPLHVTVGGKEYLVTPQLQRESSWGSLYQEDFLVPNILVSYPDTGIYTIEIFPDTILVGIYSAGIELGKKCQ